MQYLLIIIRGKQCSEAHIFLSYMGKVLYCDISLSPNVTENKKISNNNNKIRHPRVRFTAPSSVAGDSN